MIDRRPHWLVGLLLLAILTALLETSLREVGGVWRWISQQAWFATGVAALIAGLLSGAVILAVQWRMGLLARRSPTLTDD